MKYTAFITLTLTLLSFSLNPIDEVIGYRKLSWSDFKGKPNKDAIAETRTRIDLIETEIEGHFTFEVVAQFLPNESFTTTDREDILDHEQLHFDIAKLVELECFHALDHYQGCSIKYEIKAYNIYERYAKEVDRLNELYDRETRHGQSQTIQALWEKNIHNDLNKLQ